MSQLNTPRGSTTTSSVPFFSYVPSSQRPTTPTYTALMLGLLENECCKVFHKLTKSGLPLDNAALAVRLRALTGNSRPHTAFQLLEKYATDTGMATTTTSKIHSNPHYKHLCHPPQSNRIGRLVVSPSNTQRMPKPTSPMFDHLASSKV